MGKSEVDRKNILGGEGAKQGVPSQVKTKNGTYNVSKTKDGKIELTNSKGDKLTMDSPTKITPSNMKAAEKSLKAQKAMSGIDKAEVNKITVTKGSQADHHVTTSKNFSRPAGGGGIGALGIGSGGGALHEQMR